jgi:class 3 adenylate cyclase
MLKILAKINSLENIVEYRDNERITQKVPGFAVKLSFGLHLGWAIEGLIGSGFKVDASYLSPHVNIAARLEQATKQFGVHLLISG